MFVYERVLEIAVLSSCRRMSSIGLDSNSSESQYGLFKYCMYLCMHTVCLVRDAGICTSYSPLTKFYPPRPAEMRNRANH